VVKGIHRVIRRFVWNKERDKVIEFGWRWFSQVTENGGLGVPNILITGHALRVKWTIRVITSRELWVEFYKTRI